MKRSLARMCIAMTAVVCGSGPAPAQEEVYLQVTSPGLRTVVIAIPPPTQRPGTDAHAAATYMETLRRDLEQTSVIQPLARERELLVEVDPTRADLTRQRWRAVGAQFLLDSTVATVGSQLVTEIRIWDLASGDVAYSRRFQGTVPLAATMAHTLANEIVHLFTGRPGPFLSRIAFISDRTGHKELWVMRWDGSDQQQLTSHRSIALAPAWSPDGQWLAFTSFLSGRPQLYVLRPTEGYLRPISALPGVNTSASFSPDGSQVVFAAGPDGQTNIYVVPVAGGDPLRLSHSRAIETQPAFSPNGRQIAFTSAATGRPRLHLMDAEGTNARPLTMEDDFADEAAWAPDGVRLAYTTRVEGRFQIATLDLRTGQRTVIAGPGNNESPTWSPDGTMLAFQSNRTGTLQIYLTDADGRPRRLTSEGNNFQPSWVTRVN